MGKGVAVGQPEVGRDFTDDFIGNGYRLSVV